MMKLPITDRFLYDLLSVLDETAHIAGNFIGPRRSFLKALSYRDNPVFRKYKNQLGARKFSRLMYHLKVNNIIKVKSLEGKQGVMITKKGFSRALKASFVVEEKKKRKDGKWIMLIFDIPKKYHKSRNLLRSVLKNLGYKILQHSVWVCPYDVSEKTEWLLQHYNLDEFVKIFLIEAL